MLSLQDAGQPCVTLKIDSVYGLGGEFFRWEYATAIAGAILNINPFDEQNVTESKDNTNSLLKHYKEHGELPRTEAAFTEENVSLYADEKLLRLLSELSLQHQYSGIDRSGMWAARVRS